MKRALTASSAGAAKSRAIERDLHALKNPRRVAGHQKFFKTGEGEYGEGDLFLGITVPEVRAVAKTHYDAALSDLHELLESDFHEMRLCALIILTYHYRKSESLTEKKRIFDFYHKAIRDGHVNNWDLIDTAAPTIGEYLLNVDNPMPFLERQAKSKSLWLRRSSVLYTFAFIKIGEFEPTLRICKALIRDDHDLIHKATGWALREVGKRNPDELRIFLEHNAHQMPRMMLRYSIEKFSERERKMWLQAGK